MRTEKEAVNSGVLLGDGQNDVSYSQQRIDEISLRQQDIRAHRDEHTIRVEAIGRQMAIEEARLASAGTFHQSSPVDGMVWRRLVAPGSEIVIGTEIMEVVDCSDLFLQVAVDEREFDRLHPGDRASVRLVGADQEIEGVIRSLRGTKSVTEDRFLAAAPVGNEPHQAQVVVSLPHQSGLVPNASNYCQVGRTAKVTFHKDHGTSLAKTRSVVSLARLQYPFLMKVADHVRF